MTLLEEINKANCHICLLSESNCPICPQKEYKMSSKHATVLDVRTVEDTQGNQYRIADVMDFGAILPYSVTLYEIKSLVIPEQSQQDAESAEIINAWGGNIEWEHSPDGRRVCPSCGCWSYEKHYSNCKVNFTEPSKVQAVADATVKAYEDKFGAPVHPIQSHKDVENYKTPRTILADTSGDVSMPITLDARTRVVEYDDTKDLWTMGNGG
jgi:hypothetical protein